MLKSPILPHKVSSRLELRLGEMRRLPPALSLRERQNSPNTVFLARYSPKGLIGYQKYTTLLFRYITTGQPVFFSADILTSSRQLSFSTSHRPVRIPKNIISKHRKVVAHDLKDEIDILQKLDRERISMGA